MEGLPEEGTPRDEVSADEAPEDGRPEEEVPEDGVPELLTVAETAEIMRCHTNTVYSRIRQHSATDGADGIEARRLGGRIYVPRRGLEKQLGIEIQRIPSRQKPEGRNGKRPRVEDSGPGRDDDEPSYAAQPRPDQVRKAPVGYLGRVIAQWRLRR